MNLRRCLQQGLKGLATLLVSAGTALAAPAPTLKLFSWYGTETETFTPQLISQAKKAGLKLEVEPVVWDQMQPLLQARLAAGTLPDLLDLKGQDIANYAPGGSLLDISGQPWLQKMPVSVRSALRVNGKEYALPYSAAFQGVFYNRALFAKHGVKVPGTWAELMQAAAQLKAKGVTPFAMHLKDDWHIGNVAMQMALNEVFAETPDWGDKLYAGKAAFETTPGYRHVFTGLKQMADNSWKDAFSVDLTEAAKRFLKGEAAMFVSGTWLNTNLEIDPRFDYGIFPLPGTKPGAKLIFEPNHVWAVSAKTPNAAAAFKLLELVATDKALATTFVNEAGAYSLLDGVKGDRVRPGDRDIDTYRSQGKLVDVSVGNSQLKWAYQLEVAKLIAEHLLGKRGVDDALKSATAIRTKITKAR